VRYSIYTLSLVFVVAARLKRWRLDLCPLLYWWLPFYSDTLTRITAAMMMVSYIQLFWWYRHNIAIYVLFVDFLVLIFLITTLPPLLFLFLCGVGSTFASIGWFYYWRSTRPDISRRTQPQHNPSPGIVEMQQVPHV
jgi:hypothetical protein